jgi:perosamine synthetase
MSDSRGTLPASVLAALRRVCRNPERFYALHEPRFAGEEWTYTRECLDTGWVSSAGKYVDRFERMLADYTGAAHAVATVNGTAALHLCLRLAGVEPGDEVLAPALTFVATANAIAYCHAVPHFVDSEERTLGIDAAKLAGHLSEIGEVKDGACRSRRTGRRIRAVVPMHTFGHPVDMEPLLEIASRYHLVVVEDAAESLGSRHRGRHSGNDGLLSAVSFNGNKIVTTGGGGALLTNDAELARQAKHLSTTAKLPHAWEYHHDQTGYNYRMPNLNAAVGCAQLEQLPSFIKAKRALAARYSDAFAGVSGIRFLTEPALAESNYWLNVLILDDADLAARDAILETTNKDRIMTRPAWNLMHRLPMYQDCPRMDLSAAENLERRLINIPSSVSIELEHALQLEQQIT